jgi:hypothetical protein
MELIDGHPVVEHQVRFRLRTTVDERYAEQIRDGETMVWIVRALCKPPQYYPLGKEADERYKLAVQDVEAAAPLSGEAVAGALAYLDGAGDQLVLPFGNDDDDEVTELRSLLSDIGELREGERLADTFRRVAQASIQVPFIKLTAESPPEKGVAPAQPPPEMTDEEYRAGLDRVREILNDDPEPAAASPRTTVLPDGGDVEVVGSIYRGRRSSDLSDLLMSQFGEPT